MTNRIAEILKIEKPIIQGPLFWLTDAKLVAAVSNAGGLGVLGFNAGQTTATSSVDETVQRMHAEMDKVKTLTDKPFGLNVSPTGGDNDRFSQPMLDLMVEERVPVAVMVGELMPEWVKKYHDNGIKVVFRSITPTVENTKAAVKAGVDVIVATGFDEGGTIPEKVIGTFAIVPMIVDAAGDVPVMAAGGIADARTAKAAFALGAEGLFVGTAFMLSSESRLAENIKQQAISSDADDLVMYRTLVKYYRTLPGELPEKLHQMDEAGESREAIFKASNGYDTLRLGMLEGDLTQGIASFGLGISQIDKIEPVASIMDRLNSGIPA